MYLRKTKIQHLADLLGFFSISQRRDRCVWLCLLFTLLVFPLSLRAEAVPDVRVLIDVSGSMKKTDPKNLRAPAVRMLAGLMPDKARSGIWTFGRYVNMQVKHGQVGEAWKKLAIQEAGKIHSRGLFTNIEEAVATSTRDWIKPDPRYQRHLILLTDGVVDISKDAKLNEQSRRRLLHDLLPKLEAADVAVHTIALSEHADKELLTTLSGATKGGFEQVDSADQLQRIFLKLFEKSVKPDTLPIEENKFTVDKHVSDITVLIFLADDSPATQLRLPSGETWSRDSHPATVRWHHEDSYDLITVKGPVAGEWALQAKVDPDNRVMVVTNLRLKLDKLPNTLMIGDKFDVRARLLEEGKTITNKNLLSRTEFEVKQIDDQDHVETTPLSDNGSAPDVIKGDGVHSVTLDKWTKPGNYELSIRAKSLTFKRAVRHSVQVYDNPVSMLVSQESDDKPFILSIKPHSGLIRPETLSMQITLPDGETKIIEQTGELEWTANIPAEFAGKEFSLTVAGTKYTDEPVKLDFKQLLANSQDAKPQDLVVEAKPEAISEEEQDKANGDEEKEQAEEESTEKTEETAKDESEQSSEEEDGGFSWGIVLGLVIGINTILVGLGWFAYRMWRKRHNEVQAEVQAELES